MQRVEDRLARVLGRPDRGIARGGHLPAHDLRPCRRAIAERHGWRASGSARRRECLPKKLSSSAVASEVCESVEPIMPNLNGLTPSSCSSFSPSFEARAGILVLQHLGLLQLGQIEIALVPELVAGELVIRRQEGMRLAVALDLRHLVDRLEPRPRLGIFACQRRARRNRPARTCGRSTDCRCAGWRAPSPPVFVLVGVEELPELRRVLAVERRRTARSGRPCPCRRGRSRRDAGCCRCCSRSTRSRSGR